jgi:hypothetical protein
VVPNFAKIKNGKMVDEVNFISNFVASKWLKINVVVPWVNKAEWNDITILPDKPLYVSLSNSKKKLEAKKWNKAIIKAALYDRYWNLATNDSAHTINFEIPEEYRKFANFWGSYISSKTATEWVATIEATATDFPGTAFIVSKVTDPLEGNWYIMKDKDWNVMKDKDWNVMKIDWVSENVVPFDTYYLFNWDKLKNVDYNSLYTVLEWASYWDITHPGYLAGEVLFNKTWRSLAVTSVLNSPYAREVAFWFTPGGRFITNTQGSKDQTFSLSPQISTSNQWTSIDLFDSVYNELIARAWLNFDSDAQLVKCNSDTDLTISKCSIPENSSFIVLKWIWSVNTTKESDNLAIDINNFRVFSITNRWKINKDPSVSLVVDDNAQWNILGVKIMMNKEQIWYFGIKFKTDSIKVFDTSAFPNALFDASNKNQIIIEHISNDYSYDNTYLWVSSRWAKWIAFYRNENTSWDEVDKDLVSKNEKVW